MLIGVAVCGGEISAGEGDMAELFTAVEMGGECQAGGGVIAADVEIIE